MQYDATLHICCIFRNRKALEADNEDLRKEEEQRKKDESLEEQKIQAEKLAEQYQDMTLLQERALLRSTSPFELTSDELGMVKLRQGFLASQPPISQIVKRLMTMWFPGVEDNACIKFFGRKDGPWDIFYIFDFFRQAGNPENAESKGRKNIFQLLTKVLFDEDAYEQHSRLQNTLDQIFDSRNWWAHVRVGSANCSHALRAIIDFINMVAARWGRHQHHHRPEVP